MENLKYRRWKRIKGFEDSYMISSDGLVKCIKHLITKPVIKNNILKPIRAGRNGNYLAVGLCAKRFYIHRLVAEAFIPNPNNYPQINHIDNNPKNNTIKNLEWCTQKQNIIHAEKQGRMKWMENLEKAHLVQAKNKK